MASLRLMLHVLVAGAAVFASSATVLFELESSTPRIAVIALLGLLGAWAGASTLLRSTWSVGLALAGIVVLGFVRGDVRTAEVLMTSLWAVVMWRRLSEGSVGREEQNNRYFPSR